MAQKRNSYEHIDPYKVSSSADTHVDPGLLENLIAMFSKPGAVAAPVPIKPYERQPYDVGTYDVNTYPEASVGSGFPVPSPQAENMSKAPTTVFTGEGLRSAQTPPANVGPIPGGASAFGTPESGRGFGGFMEDATRVLNTPYGSLSQFSDELAKQGAPVDPNTVMSQAVASDGPPMSMSGPQSTMPQAQTQPAAKLAAGGLAPVGKPKSSPARAGSSAPAVAAQAPQVEDAIAKLLDGNKASAEGDRDSAKANAAKSKDLNDGEKIFTALMAVLPGLVGAIGGGAIAGGAGAAAGAAGGLNGGANAVGAMIGEKEQLRQEQLGLAKDAQGRVDQAGQQQFGHAENTANREDQQAFQAQQGALGMRHAEKLQLAQQRSAFVLAQMNNAAELQKAQMVAAAKGPGEIKEFQSKMGGYAGHMAIASDDISKFTSAIQGSPMQNVIANSSFANLLKNPETRQFATAVQNFLSPILHGQTGAAISEEEWQNARQTFIPSGTDDEYTTKMKESNRKDYVDDYFHQAGPAQQNVIDRINNHNARSKQQGANLPAASGAPTDIWSLMKQVQ